MGGWGGREEGKGKGKGEGEFWAPMGIAVGGGGGEREGERGRKRGGKVFVCDYFNGRVQVFSPSGRYLGKIEGKKRERERKEGENERENEREENEREENEGILLLPRGVGVLGGKVYVSDSGDNSVKCFTEEGKYLRRWDGFVDPTEVVVVRGGEEGREEGRGEGRGEGRVFVVDSGNHRVVELE